MRFGVMRHLTSYTLPFIQKKAELITALRTARQPEMMAIRRQAPGVGTVGYALLIDEKAPGRI